MYMRKSVKEQRKYHYISFIDVLSKGFISNPVKVVILTFTPGVCTTGVTFCLTGPLCHFKSKKNHFHSDAGGVKMIFLSF